MKKQSSPSATVAAFVDFPDAIRAVIDGKTITKAEWQDQDAYGRLRDGFLMIHRDGKWHRWLVNDGDLLGEDWIIRE